MQRLFADSLVFGGVDHCFCILLFGELCPVVGLG
jgi:hypothetical protein